MRDGRTDERLEGRQAGRQKGRKLDGRTDGPEPVPGKFLGEMPHATYEYIRALAVERIERYYNLILK